MSVSISSGTFMVDETNTSGERSIWAMNVSTLSEGVSQQMMADRSDISDAALAFLTARGQTIAPNDLVTVLPDIETAVSSRIGTIRDQAVQEAEAILSRSTQ